MRSLVLTIAVVACIGTRAAFAFEPGKIGDDPVNVDVTEASSVLYNVDNRNTGETVETLTDDDWGLWYNRLNLQASVAKWQVGARLDSALFFDSPDPTVVGLTLLENRRGNLDPPFSAEDADRFRRQTLEAGTDLSTKYINLIYPAKYYVGYTTPDVEATVGDFYAQFGRGLVLSVRKADELASDTTVRGARATALVRAADLRFRITGLGGTMNPLRLDEASGRFLAVDSSVTPGMVGVTEAGMPRTLRTDFVDEPTPSYSPDRLVGAQIEGGPKIFKLGVQGVLLDRQDPIGADAIRSADSARTGSISVNVPDLDGHGAVYVEGALEDIDHANAPNMGSALYASVSVLEAPFAFTVEVKHYRSFFPLRGNVDLVQAPEFNLVQYSAPPTTEAFWVDTEFEEHNTCVTGGRAKTDAHLGKDESVFVWYGHFQSWAEIDAANSECENGGIFRDHPQRTMTHDVAAGAELSSQGRKSRATMTLGSRFDDLDVPVTVDPSEPATTTFYREVYARYDVIRHLGGAWQLQLQGWHRRRAQTIGGPDAPYFQGQHLTGVSYDTLTVAAGFEFDTDPGVPTTYVNGQVQYALSSSSLVSVFAGQRRGGLRCVAGVCRVFPPFEGGRLDVTLRF